MTYIYFPIKCFKVLYIYKISNMENGRKNKQEREIWTYWVKSIDNIISEVSSGRLVRKRIWLGGCSGTPMPPAPWTGGGWLKRPGLGGTTPAPAPALAENHKPCQTLYRQNTYICSTIQQSASVSHMPQRSQMYQQLSEFQGTLPVYECKDGIIIK